MSESDGRKLNDLRVVDLRSELDKRSIDRTGVKAVLLERLQKALEDEGHDPETYLFEITCASEKKSSTPTRKDKKGEGDDFETTKSSENDLTKTEDEGDEDEDDEGEEDEGHVGTGKENKMKMKVDGDDSKKETEKDMEVTNGMDVKKTAESATIPKDKENGNQIGEETEDKNRDKEVQKQKKKRSSSSLNDKEDLLKKEAKSESNSGGGGAGAGGVDNEDSINLTIGEDEEKLLGDEEDSSQEKDRDGDEKNSAKEELQGGKKKKAVSNSPSVSKNNEPASNKEKATVKSVTSVLNVGGMDEESSSKEQSSSTNKKQESGSSSGSSVTTRNLWVSGLSSTTRATDLKEIFSKYGKVVGAKVVTDARKPGARCYGYITMGTMDDAVKCIKHLHHSELHGRMISVEKAKGESTAGNRKSDETCKAKPASGDNREHSEKASSGVKGDRGRSGSKHQSPAKKEKDVSKDKKDSVPLPWYQQKLVPPGTEGSSDPNGCVENEGGVAEKKTESETPATAATETEADSAGHKNSKEAADKKEKSKDSNDKQESHHGKHSHHGGGHRSKEHSPHSARSRHGRGASKGSHSSHKRNHDGQVHSEDKFKVDFLKLEYKLRVEEKERELREVKRVRREQREVERKQREEAHKLEREREKLRRDREKLEQERSELLQLQKEIQRLERERLEREKEELKRQKMKLEEERRSTKRQLTDNMEPDHYEQENRKRPKPVPPPPDIRRYESSPSTRFDHRSNFRGRGSSSDDHRNAKERPTRDRYESNKDALMGGVGSSGKGETWRGHASIPVGQSHHSRNDNWVGDSRRQDSPQPWVRPPPGSYERWEGGGSGVGGVGPMNNVNSSTMYPNSAMSAIGPMGMYHHHP